MLGEFAVRSFVEYRQYRRNNSKKLPDSIQGIFTEEQVDNSFGYNREKARFSIAKRAFATVLRLGNLSVLPQLWGFAGLLSGNLASSFPRFFTGNATLQSLIFAALETTIRVLAGTFWTYYQEFYLEEKWGFNKYTVSRFFKHKVLLYILSLAISQPFIYGLLKIYDHFGSASLKYAMILTSVGQLFIETVFPLLLQLFYKITPLPEGELRTAIEKLARKNEFPVTQIYQMDGSSTTLHSNAFFVGLPWSKKIVLFDTIINSQGPDEIVAVLAHEIGHWKLNHISQMLSFSQLQIASTFALFSGFISNRSLFQSFGLEANAPPYLAFTLFSLIAIPLDLINDVFMNLLIRKNEYQADRFAVHEGHKEELGAALIQLEKDNLSAMTNDWLYSILFATHPSLPERLDAIGYVASKKEENDSLDSEKKQAELNPHP